MNDREMNELREAWVQWSAWKRVPTCGRAQAEAEFDKRMADRDLAPVPPVNHGLIEDYTAVQAPDRNAVAEAIRAGRSRGNHDHLTLFRGPDIDWDGDKVSVRTSGVAVGAWGGPDIFELREPEEAHPEPADLDAVARILADTDYDNIGCGGVEDADEHWEGCQRFYRAGVDAVLAAGYVISRAEEGGVR